MTLVSKFTVTPMFFLSNMSYINSFNILSAGSVVQQDPTERLHLMSGKYSPVKAKNVVPHDIGDPGRKRRSSFSTQTVFLLQNHPYTNYDSVPR